MKISKMTTDQAADALVKMSEAVSEMVADEAAIPMLQALANQFDGENYKEGITAVLMRLIPFLLKTHRKALYTIIGALDGKSEEELVKFNFLSTVRIIRDSFDQDLIDFFKSSGPATKPGKEE